MIKGQVGHLKISDENTVQFRAFPLAAGCTVGHLDHGRFTALFPTLVGLTDGSVQLSLTSFQTEVSGITKEVLA